MISIKNFLLAFCLIVPVMTILTTPPETMSPSFFADEAVYFGMIQSLALDLDLTWTRQDMQRICQSHPAGPVGVILKKQPDGDIVYAKPVTYPLIAGFFYRLMGSRGIILLNLLSAWMILLLLSRHWGSNLTGTVSAICFLMFTAWSPYILWYHPEIFTSFLLAGFVAEWMTTADGRNPSLKMPIFLALAVTIKPPVIILGIPAALDMIRSKRWKPFAVFVFVTAVIMMLTILFTGDLNPYEGNRRIFINQFPLDVPVDLFGIGDSWSMENAGFYFDFPVFLWNIFYFCFGRFSGIAWYFLPVLATSLAALMAPANKHGKWLLTCSGILILLQLILIPSNYHGGGGALGNRYFVNLYPMLLMALPAIPGRRFSMAVIAFAGILSGPFLIHPWLSSREPGEFTRHGFFSNLPAEWTLAGAYPIFHPSLYRVQYEAVDGQFYFLDRYTSGGKGNGFEVYSGGTGRMIIELNTPMEYLEMLIVSDRRGASGSITVDGAGIEFNLAPETIRPVRIRLHGGHRKTDIHGIDRWIYPAAIRFEPVSAADPSTDTAAAVPCLRVEFPVTPS